MESRDEAVLVVLEPANHIGRVIRAAKERGMHVVAFHHFPLATVPPYGPDFALIDDAYRVERWDEHDALLERILAACAGRRIAGTYAGQEYTLELEARVRAAAGLPHNPPETLRAVLDKHRVRQTLAAAGLTRVRFWGRAEVDGWREWPQGLSAYFKPAHGGGSCLVRRCRSMEDLRAAWGMWSGKHDVDAYPPFRAYVERDDRYLLEEEIPGRLMSLEGWVYDGEYHPIGATGRHVLRRDPSVEMGCYFPRAVPDPARVAGYVAAVHRALGLRHGPTHTELMLTDDGEVELVELNARFVGADMLICMDLVFGAPVEDQLLELACGRPMDPAVFARAEGVAQLRYLLPPLELETFECLRFPPEVAFEKVMKRPGDRIVSNRNQLDRIAGCIVTGRDEADSLERLDRVLAATTVNGRALARDENFVTL